MASCRDHLKDLLRKYQLTKRSLSNTLKEDDQLLVHIADKISEWEALVPHLRLTTSDKDSIKNDETTTGSRKTKLLQKWTHKHGIEATALALIKSFIDANRRDLASDVCEFCKQENRETISFEESDEQVIEKKTRKSLTIEKGDMKVTYVSEETSTSRSERQRRLTHNFTDGGVTHQAEQTHNNKQAKDTTSLATAATQPSDVDTSNSGNPKANASGPQAFNAGLSETTNAPDPSDNSNAPGLSETTDTPDPSETSNAPDQSETTNTPDPSDNSNAPGPSETTDALNLSEITDAPDLSENSNVPDLPSEITDVPDPSENSNAPDQSENSNAPDPSETSNVPDPNKTSNAPDPTPKETNVKDSSRYCRHVIVASGLCALLCLSITIAGIATAEKAFKLRLPTAGDSGVVISNDSIIFVEKFDPFSVEEVKFKAKEDICFYVKRCEDISFSRQTVEQSRNLNVTASNTFALSQYYLVNGSTLNYQIRLEINDTQDEATADSTKCLAELKVFNTTAAYCKFLRSHKTTSGVNTKCLTSEICNYTLTAVEEPKYYFTALYIPDPSVVMSVEYNISGHILTYNVSNDQHVFTPIQFENKGTHNPSNDDMCVLARASRDEQDTCENQDLIFYEAEVRGESRKLYYSLHVGSYIFAVICIILMLTFFIAAFVVVCA